MKQYFVKYTIDDGRLQSNVVDVVPIHSGGETFNLIRVAIAEKHGTKVYNILIDSIQILN